MSLISSISNFFVNIYVFLWDILLTLINLVTPKLPVGKVVPKGKPGAGGEWPEYIPPKEGESRSPCPALNALANHGILPRDGKNISFKELNHTVRATFNFAPTFCFFVPNFSANMLKKSYSKDTFDLADLSLHNGIEHDASLTREDTVHQADQGKPHLPFVQELLASASGKNPDGSPLLTAADLSKYSGIRRANARASNPEFSLSLFHKMFGSSNSATLLTIFGGQVRDLEPVLTEERIPKGWEPRVRSRFGLTMNAFNLTAFKVELGIKEKKPSGSEASAPAENP